MAVSLLPGYSPRFQKALRTAPAATERRVGASASLIARGAADGDRRAAPSGRAALRPFRRRVKAAAAAGARRNPPPAWTTGHRPPPSLRGPPWPARAPSRGVSRLGAERLLLLIRGVGQLKVGWRALASREKWSPGEVVRYQGAGVGNKGGRRGAPRAAARACRGWPVPPRQDLHLPLRPVPGLRSLTNNRGVGKVKVSGRWLESSWNTEIRLKREEYRTSFLRHSVRLFLSLPRYSGFGGMVVDQGSLPMNGRHHSKTFLDLLS